MLLITGVLGALVGFIWAWRAQGGGRWTLGLALASLAVMAAGLVGYSAIIDGA